MLGVLHGLLMKKPFISLFLLKSAVLCILLMAVSLWSSNEHSRGCLWSWPTFSSQIFPSDCLCAVDWLTSYMLWRYMVSPMSSPNVWKPQLLKTERALKTGAGSPYLGRLFPRCVMLSNSLLTLVVRRSCFQIAQHYSWCIDMLPKGKLA